MQFAFGGSYEVDQPDAVVGRLGLTGIPFTSVYNGCATAGSALAMASQAIQIGEYDVGLVRRDGQAPPGAFTADPISTACPRWYGETGLFLTTHFFGMKINRYMHDHGITHQTLAQVAAKNYRNGAVNPNAWRRTPLSVEEILASRDAQLPADAVHVLQPGRGAPRPWCCAAPTRRPPLHRSAGLPAQRA